MDPGSMDPTRARVLPPPRRSASTGARRPPPSASQVTESGLPFPVIDTSAKHSSLFVPPDTSGLTKKEARLVKNRAAAFLSRQRKREQFDELASKCRSLARLSWLLWDALGHATMEPASRMAMMATHGGIEQVIQTTLLRDKLKYESEDVWTTLQQVVQQHGSMIVEGIMGDDVPPLKTRTNGMVAQLAATQKECDELRAEVQRLQSGAMATTPAQAFSSGDIKALPGSQMRASPIQSATTQIPGQGPGSLVSMPTSGASPAADSLVQLVGRALIQLRHATPDCDAHELLPRDDGSLQLRMSVSPTSDVLLCTLASESGGTDSSVHADELDDKQWRCSTPIESSEATSVPSLSTSTSPSLSSLSSGSAFSRRHRHVIAYYTGTERSASFMHELHALDLNEWVSQYGTALGGGQPDHISRAVQDLHTRLLQRRLGVQPGCFLAASYEHDAGKNSPCRLTLYAKCVATPEPMETHAHFVSAVRDTLGALHHEPTQTS